MAAIITWPTTVAGIQLTDSIRAATSRPVLSIATETSPEQN